MSHKKDVHGKPIRHPIIPKPKLLGTGMAAQAATAAQKNKARKKKILDDLK